MVKVISNQKLGIGEKSIKGDFNHILSKEKADIYIFLNENWKIISPEVLIDVVYLKFKENEAELAALYCDFITDGKIEYLKPYKLSMLTKNIFDYPFFISGHLFGQPVFNEKSKHYYHDALLKISNNFMIAHLADVFLEYTGESPVGIS